MNYRIAKKILTCKSSLHLNDNKVFIAKMVYVTWDKYTTKVFSDGIITTSKHRKGLKK